MKAFYIDNLKNDSQILIDNGEHKTILYDNREIIFFTNFINTGLGESQGFLFYEKPPYPSPQIVSRHIKKHNT